MRTAGSAVNLAAASEDSSSLKPGDAPAAGRTCISLPMKPHQSIAAAAGTARRREATRDEISGAESPSNDASEEMTPASISMMPVTLLIRCSVNSRSVSLINKNPASSSAAAMRRVILTMISLRRPVLLRTLNSRKNIVPTRRSLAGCVYIIKPQKHWTRKKRSALTTKWIGHLSLVLYPLDPASRHLHQAGVFSGRLLFPTFFLPLAETVGNIIRLLLCPTQFFPFASAPAGRGKFAR